MHPALEIPVSAENRGAGKVVFPYGRVYILGKRAAVPYARRAPVPDQTEAQLLKVGGKPRGVEIIGHHPRSRREARFHVGRNGESALNGFLREKSRSYHNGGVGGVGAARYGGYHHGAVREPVCRARGIPVCAFCPKALVVGSFHVAERYPVLRTARAREGRLDGRYIK